MVPNFHRDIVLGVASYAVELFRAAPRLDTVYVPIGMGSGIIGTIAARNALGLTKETAIVGVVTDEAPTYALSFEAGKPVSTQSASTMADGLAVREPNPIALALICKWVDRIVKVCCHYKVIIIFPFGSMRMRLLRPFVCTSRTLIKWQKDQVLLPWPPC
jgi:threonine dehydratase